MREFSRDIHYGASGIPEPVSHLLLVVLGFSMIGAHDGDDMQPLRGSLFSLNLIQLSVLTV